MDIYEKMRVKILEIGDPNSPYTQEDFNKEFSNVNHTFVSNPEAYKIKVVFTNKSTNPDPAYATAGSSGFDFRADLDKATVPSMVIRSGKTAIVPTGLYFELPENFEIQVRPRSGLAAKNGVTVLNTPGTIDADYRGEIKVILINLGEEDFVINHGDRIAQGVVATVTAKNIINLSRVSEISTNTERGAGGFGSTGRN
jgi:dUTP pyrophosphatase